MTIANLQFKLARTTHSARKRSQLVVLGRAIRRGKVRSGRSDGREAHLELEALARAVHELLSHSPSGTVVTVLGDGSFRADVPSQPLSAWERRSRPAAQFIRTNAAISEQEVQERIEQGLRKLGTFPPERRRLRPGE